LVLRKPLKWQGFFLETDFEWGRHQVRVEKISKTLP
jgi:ribose 5-phosphate isomerase RpiB